MTYEQGRQNTRRPFRSAVIFRERGKGIERSHRERGHVCPLETKCPLFSPIATERTVAQEVGPTPPHSKVQSDPMARSRSYAVEVVKAHPVVTGIIAARCVGHFELRRSGKEG